MACCEFASLGLHFFLFVWCNYPFVGLLDMMSCVQASKQRRESLRPIICRSSNHTLVIPSGPGPSGDTRLHVVVIIMIL